MPFKALRFYSNFGKCPAFQPDGSRDVAAWMHGDITAAVKKIGATFLPAGALSQRCRQMGPALQGFQLTCSAVVGGVASASLSNRYGIIFLGVS